MIKTSNSILLLALLFAIPGRADEVRAIDDWDDVEGVTVQPQERVDQINAYRKKLLEEEKKKLTEGWEEEGFTVQSEERVKHLNELEKTRREKEIRELKCNMCTMRCNIVRDAGQANCTAANAGKNSETCRNDADDFLEDCLEQCEQCAPDS
jgi:hypothetical protein